MADNRPYDASRVFADMAMDVEAARPLTLAAGVAGQASPDRRPGHDPQTLGRLNNRDRNETELPTMATNYLGSTDRVNTPVGSGRADLSVPTDDVQGLWFRAAVSIAYQNR